MAPADRSPATSGRTSAFAAGQGPSGPYHITPAARIGRRPAALGAHAPAHLRSSGRLLQYHSRGTAECKHGSGTVGPVPGGADVGLRRSAGSDGRDVPAAAHADARTAG